MRLCGAMRSLCSTRNVTSSVCPGSTRSGWLTRVAPGSQALNTRSVAAGSASIAKRPSFAVTANAAFSSTTTYESICGWMLQ